MQGTDYIHLTPHKITSKESKISHRSSPYQVRNERNDESLNCFSPKNFVEKRCESSIEPRQEIVYAKVATPIMGEGSQPIYKSDYYLQNHNNNRTQSNITSFPTGVTHNFVFPSFDFVSNNDPLITRQLPVLRFQDSDYRKTLPILESTLPSLSNPSTYSQQPLFPEWFVQEKHRVLRTNPTN